MSSPEPPKKRFRLDLQEQPLTAAADGADTDRRIQQLLASPVRPTRIRTASRPLQPQSWALFQPESPLDNPLFRDLEAAIALKAAPYQSQVRKRIREMGAELAPTAELGALLYLIDRGEPFDMQAFSFVALCYTDIHNRLAELSIEHQKEGPNLPIPSGQQSELLRILCRMIYTPQGRFSRAGIETVRELSLDLPVHNWYLKQHIHDRCEEIQALCDAQINALLLKELNPDPAMRPFIELEWLTKIPEDRPLPPEMIIWSLLHAIFTPMEQEENASNCYAVAPCSIAPLTTFLSQIRESLEQGSFHIGKTVIPIPPILNSKVHYERTMRAAIPSTMPIVERLQAAGHFTPPAKDNFFSFPREMSKEVASFTLSALQQLFLTRAEMWTQNQLATNSSRDACITKLIEICCPLWLNLTKSFIQQLRRQMERHLIVQDRTEKVFSPSQHFLYVGQQPELLCIRAQKSEHEALVQRFLEARYLATVREGHRLLRSPQDIVEEIIMLAPTEHKDFVSHLRTNVVHSLVAWADEVHQHKIERRHFRQIFFLQQSGGVPQRTIEQLGLGHMVHRLLEEDSCLSLLDSIQTTLRDWSLFDAKKILIAQCEHIFLLTPYINLYWQNPDLMGEIEKRILIPGRAQRKPAVPDEQQMRSILARLGIEHPPMDSNLPSDPWEMAEVIQSKLAGYNLSISMVYRAICEELRLPEMFILGTLNYSDNGPELRRMTLLVAQYNPDTRTVELAKYANSTLIWESWDLYKSIALIRTGES